MPFLRGTIWQSHNYYQKAISLNPAKFHAILTLRPMISISTFLPCMVISSTRESMGRPWQSVLHHIRVQIQCIVYIKKSKNTISMILKNWTFKEPKMGPVLNFYQLNMQFSQLNYQFLLDQFCVRFLVKTVQSIGLIHFLNHENFWHILLK